VREGYDDNVDTSSFDRQGSFFTNGSLALNYEFGNARTRLDLTAIAGITYYYDRSSDQDYDINTSFSLSITHKATPRLTLAASAYVTYQSEPNFALNTGINRRGGNFFYALNKFSGSYQWAPRFSTATSYTLGIIHYDNSGIGAVEDRFEHTIGNEFRFLVLPTTTLVGEYRVQFIDYDTAARDSTSQFALAGIDHSFNPRFGVSLRAGGEFRSTDNFGDSSEPYFEGTVNYALGRRTSVSWTSRYSIEEPDVAASPRRTTFRTGLQAKYSLTPKLTSSLGVFYQHDDNKQSNAPVLLSPQFTEQTIDLSLGLSYAITRNFSVEAGYSWTEVYSDIVLREYSRNRFYLGLNANF
jgi:hypothetical protein